MSNDAPTHLDIFSGIGGFAIAAQWAGFETVGFCESDLRCRTFLEKAWGKPVHPDIRTFDPEPYRGVSLLTGGPPCQPASRAGKQGGEGDDRWLWPEALRVLEEAKPDCVVFENPPGILDVGIDGILSEMGRVGYETQVFDIPACAVDSPQLRHRLWFVGFLADAESGGRNAIVRHDDAREPDIERCVQIGLPDAEGIGCGEVRPESNTSGRTGACSDRSHMADIARDSERGIRAEAGADSERVGQPCEPDSGSMADTAEPGREGRDAERAPDGCRPQCPQSHDWGDAERECEQRRALSERREDWSLSGVDRPSTSVWANSVWVPCADGKLRRAPDDSFGLVDGLHRSLLAALGNSICPEVAFQILRAVRPLIAI